MHGPAERCRTTVALLVRYNPPTMPALLACSPECFPGAPLEVVCRGAREAGFEAVSLGVGDRDGNGDGDAVDPLAPHDRSDARDLDRLRGVLDAHGLRVASCDVSSGACGDPGWCERFVRKLDVARSLGVARVTCDAGAEDDPAAWDAFVAAWRRAGDACGERGLTVCLRTGPGPCGHHRGMETTLRAVDHPAVRLDFDTGWYACLNGESSVETGLARVCHRVGHAVLRDATGAWGERHFPELGCGGAVDFLRVLQLLRPCGFEGPYAVATPGTFGARASTYDECVRRLRASRTYLARLGYLDG
jgi:sugar phosphate isomerase/epimerase